MDVATGGVAVSMVAGVLEDNVPVIVGGLVIAIGAGLFLGLFNRIMENFGHELSEFKEEVDKRFDTMEYEVKEVQNFRTEFLARGWNHMPPGMNDGPGLAVTIAKMDAKLDTLDAKFDEQKVRFDSHDKWERQQKWSHPSAMHIEGEITTEET